MRVISNQITEVSPVSSVFMLPRLRRAINEMWKRVQAIDEALALIGD